MNELFKSEEDGTLARQPAKFDEFSPPPIRSVSFAYQCRKKTPSISKYVTCCFITIYYSCPVDFDRLGVGRVGERNGQEREKAQSWWSEP
jgi:hypothetical protein